MNATANKHPSVVFRLGHMGDVALITGVLWHWHAKTGATFVFVTREDYRPLIENHPAVTEIVGLSDADIKEGSWFKKSGELARRFAGHPLLDLHGTLRSRILSLRWQGPIHRYPKSSLARRVFERTGSQSLRTKLEAVNVPQRYALTLDKTPPPREDVVPHIFLTDQERAKATDLLNQFPSSAPLIGLHPYATHPSKQWPTTHWLTLIELLEAMGFNWFVMGRNNVPLKADHERDLTNKTDLRTTCALLDRADLLVTGDSGPMHLACSVDTPVVAIFGPTARAWGFYPAGPMDVVLENEELDCRPCSLHGAKTCTKGFECMTETEPGTVLASIRSILQQAKA